MVTDLAGQDSRFTGGFGIYDAPNPWGPWTTVFYTEAWDVGPGDTSSFPTKWMSGDGKTLFLVFSGDDHFSVRKGTLTLREPRQIDRHLDQLDEINVEGIMGFAELKGLILNFHF